MQVLTCAIIHLLCKKKRGPKDLTVTCLNMPKQGRRRKQGPRRKQEPRRKNYHILHL